MGMPEKGKKKRYGAEEALELWERMANESVRNYGYFCAYRDMRYTPAANAEDPPKLELSRPRSLRSLAAQLGLKNYRTLGDLSTRFNWQVRCDAYDLHILRLQRDRNEIKILKMRDNHAAVGEQMVRRGLRRILSITDDEIKAGDMVRLIEAGVKIERLSRMDTAEYAKQQSGYGETAGKETDTVENNLLNILLHGTEKDIGTDDISELQ